MTPAGARTVLIREAAVDAVWVCIDHPTAKGTPYVDVMECVQCGHAMSAPRIDAEAALFGVECP